MTACGDPLVTPRGLNFMPGSLSLSLAHLTSGAHGGATLSREHGWKGAYMRWLRVAVAQYRHAHDLALSLSLYWSRQALTLQDA
jgi:hypothetical protein